MSRKYPHGRKLAPMRKRAAKRTGPLARWLADNKVTLTAFAAEIGASVQHVSNLVHGNSSPGMSIAVSIERATGGAVRVESWL